jgi:hypothetical protein
MILRNTILLSLIFSLFFSQPVRADENGIYYIRYDYKSRNGVVIEGNFLMIPANEEFRYEAFSSYRISGSSLSSSKPDPLTAAKNNAFENLLLNNGVKSVNSKSTTQKTTYSDESVLSYEGFIKTPYTIQNQGYTKNGMTYEIVMDVQFSPMTYPTEWSFGYFKKKLYDTLHNMLSIFF